jgi:negative regulator of sigma E activity
MSLSDELLCDWLDVGLGGETLWKMLEVHSPSEDGRVGWSFVWRNKGFVLRVSTLRRRKHEHQHEQDSVEYSRIG